MEEKQYLTILHMGSVRSPLGIHLRYCKYYNYGKVNSLEHNHADPKYFQQETRFQFVPLINDKYNSKVL